MTSEPAPDGDAATGYPTMPSPSEAPRHPVYLVPGPPGDRTAEDFLPAGLTWAETGPDPMAEAIGLLREMDADPSALDALTGFAGLERLLVWAKAQATAEVAPAGVRIGETADRQLSWLRRLQGPAQLSDMLDLISPRVDRHRSMPAVFGDRARRARLLESLWAWGRSWQRVVDGGGVRLRAAGPVDPTVASVAAWLGVVVEAGGSAGGAGAVVDGAAGADAAAESVRRPRLTLADLGVGGDGAPLFRLRVRAPLHLAFPEFDGSSGGTGSGGEAGEGADADRRQAFLLDDGADPAAFAEPTVDVDASPRGVAVQVAGILRRFDAPAILSRCVMEKVRVTPPDTWVDGWGDILVWFRADPAQMP
ncbi:hypothetical protein [Corynebacterium freneyi]|uniref:Uncharacterized protein n=1 Tax=Corynebacterium freneyi DNF00450 TaxID=1287475 RepID=A0A095YA28_9CORY|nr:hypothetical protein [Corynebacterium freneyi]KGF19088.1 hypothetical protein HMPREF1650_00630 [Corynebacterium freneyi DNF00450]